MLTKTLTFAIAAAVVNSPAAPNYNPAYPDIDPLPMEVFGEASSPKIVIVRLKAIDNLDGFDMFSPDRADFYAVVTVNDISFRTGIMAMDHGAPRWEIPLPTNIDRANVRIRIMDEDGGLERNDDHVDVSRGSDKKDVLFTYFPWTGRVSGDVNGWKGDTFYTRGVYDGDKAHLWFTVE